MEKELFTLIQGGTSCATVWTGLASWPPVGSAWASLSMGWERSLLSRERRCRPSPLGLKGWRVLCARRKAQDLARQPWPGAGV